MNKILKLHRPEDVRGGAPIYVNFSNVLAFEAIADSDMKYVTEITYVDGTRDDVRETADEIYKMLEGGAK